MKNLMDAKQTKFERDVVSGSMPDYVLCTSHDLAPILQAALSVEKGFAESKAFKQAYKEWQKGLRKAAKKSKGSGG